MEYLKDKFTQAELDFIAETGVIFDEVIGTPPQVDEQLVTDYIMIAGYTTTEAYAAAELVAKYDQM